MTLIPDHPMIGQRCRWRADDHDPDGPVDLSGVVVAARATTSVMFTGSGLVPGVQFLVRPDCGCEAVWTGTFPDSRPPADLLDGDAA